MDTQTLICPNCGTTNAFDALQCVNCGYRFVQATLSFSRLEIDDHDATLRITPDQGKPYTIRLVARLMTIGSNPDQDLPLNVPGIDPYHARLKQEGTQYRLYNISSGKRVFVNQETVTDSRVLHSADTIRLEDEHGHGVTLVYSNPIEDALPQPTNEQFFGFGAAPFTIGRDPASTLKIDTLSVSWHHAQITQQGTAHVLVDLNSTNGTFVNDRVIKMPHRLHHNDVIRIDQTLLVYQSGGLRRRSITQDFQLDAIDLGMTYKSGFPAQTLTTLNGISLSIKPKEFVAIIGGSGSGKSTLLRALNGAQHATSGQVLINGDNFYTHYALYQPSIGYVPQADIVHDGLTVFESLWFSARLRFPNEPRVSRQQRVDRVLETLELTHFANRLVGKLSGGQKKRVSIALEMMAEPSLLFMDEPSSGLDEGLDKSMMNTLRRLADRGHIVVVVTHTTLNIDLCDQLAIMSGGYLIYYGPPKQALTFFGVRTYSEIYERVTLPPTDTLEPHGTLILNSSQINQMQAAPGSTDPTVIPEQLWAAHYRSTPLYSEFVQNRLQAAKTPEVAGDQGSDAPLQRRQGGTFWLQTRVLTERTLTLARRDARTIILLLFVLPLVALFLAGNSYDKLFGQRGQMLVTAANVQTDKLPVTTIDDTCSQLSSSAQAIAGVDPCAIPGEKVKTVVHAIATFTPANDAQRLLFMMSLSVTLLGIFATAYTIITERGLFARERMVNLQIAPYLLSKVIIYGGLSLLSCALLLIILAFGVRLPDNGLITWGPLELLISLALTALAGVSIGLLLSAVTRQVNAVTYLVLAVLFVQILFPGILFKMEGTLEPLSQLTITRWSLESLGGTAHMLDRNNEGRTILKTELQYPPPMSSLPGAIQMPSPLTLSVTYPTTSGALWVHWGVLLGASLLFLVGASFVLRRSDQA